jgi:hypothetical protein
MIKVKWTERITNEEVLRRLREKRNIINSLRRREGEWMKGKIHSANFKTQ